EGEQARSNPQSLHHHLDLVWLIPPFLRLPYLDQDPSQDLLLLIPYLLDPDLLLAFLPECISGIPLLLLLVPLLEYTPGLLLIPGCLLSRFPEYNSELLVHLLLVLLPECILVPPPIHLGSSPSRSISGSSSSELLLMIIGSGIAGAVLDGPAFLVG
ncbi:hypothetical protein PIB30_090838, partial [Stylosanthes scabra]|nr:hypothetical protein [Stylosanthes scabra]